MCADRLFSYSWFKGVTQQSCKCGSEKCRGTLGKRSDALQNKPSPPAPTKGKGKGKVAKGTYKTKKTSLTHTVTVKKAKVAIKSIGGKLKALSGKGKAKVTKTTTMKVTKKTANILAKPKAKPKTLRKAPIQRRPTPAPSPVPTVSDSGEEDEIASPDRQLLASLSAPPPPPPSVRRPRITRTYKVNKTYAQNEVGKAITSEENLEGAKGKVLEEVMNTLATSADSIIATTKSTTLTTKRTTRRLTIPGERRPKAVAAI